MKAVTCTEGEFDVVDLPAPEPLSDGQLRAEGAALRHLRLRPARARALRRPGRHRQPRSATTACSARGRRVIGHEFSGEVLESGPGTTVAPGTRVVAFPLLRRGQRGAHHRAVAVGARRVRRTGARRGGDDVRGSRRARHRRRYADRTDGRRVARGAAQRHHEEAGGRRRRAAGRSGWPSSACSRPTGCVPIVAERSLARVGARWPRTIGADVVVDPAQESPWAAAERPPARAHREAPPTSSSWACPAWRSCARSR